jgi:hypothetical protein
VQFKEHLIKAGEEGGRQAAQELKEGVLEYMKTSAPKHANFDVVGHIYLNLIGLNKQYTSRGISGVGVFASFVKGFNHAHRMIKIIDVGWGKERVDSEMNGNL